MTESDEVDGTIVAGGTLAELAEIDRHVLALDEAALPSGRDEIRTDDLRTRQ
jgi:hypothetical protein